MHYFNLGNKVLFKIDFKKICNDINIVLVNLKVTAHH